MKTKNISFIRPDDAPNYEYIDEIIELANTKKYHFVQFEYSDKIESYCVIAFSKNKITENEALMAWGS